MLRTIARNLVVGAIALLATATVARVAEAAPCTYTVTIICNGVFVCTTTSGNSCITCPR